jgi:hypothetical protein
VLVTLVRLETGPAPLRGRNFLTFKIFPNPLSLPLPLPLTRPPRRGTTPGRFWDGSGTAQKSKSLGKMRLGTVGRLKRGVYPLSPFRPLRSEPSTRRHSAPPKIPPDQNTSRQIRPNRTRSGGSVTPCNAEYPVVTGSNTSAFCNTRPLQVIPPARYSASEGGGSFSSSLRMGRFQAKSRKKQAREAFGGLGGQFHEFMSLICR